MLTVNFESTFEISATLTDDAGDPETGATVTVVIEDESGTEVVASTAMQHQGGGIYAVTIGHDQLTIIGHRYEAIVEAISGTNRRKARVGLYTQWDRD